MTAVRRPAALLAVALAATACAPRTATPGATAAAAAAEAASPEGARWARRAAAVTITRDDWGIAHVHGRTDADAVFGMIYAQAEDDFARIESNYLDALGRRAEAEGEKAVWQDLRQRLFIDDDSLRAQYAASPAPMRALMDAWADGLNFYLARHPAVTPRAIRRFEPWMALSFSEGSIGGDIERIRVDELEAFYARRLTRPASGALDTRLDPAREDRGSNGIAIAPKLTTAGRALLLINPHTSFFFRSELGMRSDEGLAAYGAATWGQFFLYQGFNDRLGWMHTSSGVDVVDEFAETVTERDGKFSYRYGGEERPVVPKAVTIRYRTADGTLASRTVQTYRTHHGPIVREANGKWVAVALMHRPVAALSQSWGRTKARTLAEFRQVMALRANSSNATLYADADGNIAYFHPQFVPRRDDRFDYGRPVDGSDPATDWKGDHELAELPEVVNPGVGWTYNTNNWPYTASGPDSPRRDRFPRYMDGAGESARGQHALRLLTGVKDVTPQSLNALAYDSYLPGFATLVPPLLAAYDALPAGDSLKARLAGPVAELRGWDYRWDVRSVATSVAVFHGTALLSGFDRRSAPPRDPARTELEWVAANTPPARMLQALAAAVDRLEREHGGWRTPWGEINRFQRLTGDIVHRFDDAAPSIPVGFTHGMWGSLASFAAAPRNGTKKWYGTSGNSFVSVVEFGRDSVRAIAVTAGGESGDPKSPHFNDQAERYATGRLRPVYFYPAQLEGHVERRYHPGQ